MQISNKQYLFITLLLLLFPMIFLSACGKSMDDAIEHEENFSGIVTEKNENYILVSVNEEDDEYASSDLIQVSLDVELEGSMDSFRVGDEVTVYYDGAIAESYPAQVNTVYAITLLTPVEHSDAETPNALVPSIMYEGAIFYMTDQQLPVEMDENAIIGHVESTVPLSQWPEENGQANFDCLDAPFARYENGLVVLVDHEWTYFEPR